MARRSGSLPLVKIAVGLIIPLVVVVGMVLANGSSESTEPRGTGEPSEAAASAESDASILEILLIVAFIAGSFVFALWFARFMIRRVSRADVLENGVPATAVIISMSETGTTVNDHPLVEFELRVTLDGFPPYDATVRQVLPRLLLARVQPGITVGVRVMAQEPASVAIDWDSVKGGGDPSLPTVPGGMFAGTPVNTEVVDTDAFLARSIRAHAEIDQMSETEMTVPHPNRDEPFEVFGFVLTVQQDGQPNYTATLLQGVPPEHKGRVGPGASVPIGINPDDPADVAIDWQAHAAEQSSP